MTDLTTATPALIAEVLSLREQLEAASEDFEAANARVIELEDHMQHFADRCERGEIRSRKTLTAFRAALGKGGA